LEAQGIYEFFKSIPLYVLGIILSCVGLKPMKSVEPLPWGLVVESRMKPKITFSFCPSLAIIKLG
jgi:hypothetical protein